MAKPDFSVNYSFESYNSYKKNNNLDEEVIEEGIKDFISRIGLRERSFSEKKKIANSILTNTSKLNELVNMLKSHNNPIHYENFKKALSLYEKGEEALLYNFIVFVLDNWDDLKEGNPVYYQANIDTGEVDDTGKVNSFIGR